VTVRVNVRWGHLDRMPKCRHGRVICSDCDERARKFADHAFAATGRGPLTDEQVRQEMDQPCCRWCGAQVFPNTPCACDRAQEEARRIRGGDR
jgi:hypothetical protein